VHNYVNYDDVVLLPPDETEIALAARVAHSSGVCAVLTKTLGSAVAASRLADARAAAATLANAQVDASAAARALLAHRVAAVERAYGAEREALLAELQSETLRRKAPLELGGSAIDGLLLALVKADELRRRRLRTAVEQSAADGALLGEAGVEALRVTLDRCEHSPVEAAEQDADGAARALAEGRAQHVPMLDASTSAMHVAAARADFQHAADGRNEAVSHLRRLDVLARTATSRLGAALRVDEAREAWAFAASLAQHGLAAVAEAVDNAEPIPPLAVVTAGLPTDDVPPEMTVEDFTDAMSRLQLPTCACGPRPILITCSLALSRCSTMSSMVMRPANAVGSDCEPGGHSWRCVRCACLALS
jgi:hypothetical protein